MVLGRYALVALASTVATSAALSPPVQESLSADARECVRGVRDEASQACLGASSAPQLGKLYPLSVRFNLDPEGRVGVGTTSPQAGLHAIGAAPGDDGVRAVGRDDVAAFGEGGAGLRAFGSPPYGPGVLAFGAFLPGEGSAPGVVGHGGGDDEGGAQAGVEGFGGDGVGSLGGRGVVGHGGFTNGPFSIGGHGVVGIAGAGETPGLAVFADGDFGGTGAKYFIHPHPADPAREIRFVCLEGNESGTYFRGSGRTVDGRAVIVVPEEFRLVTSADAVTVQVTAIGARADLWVESKDLERIVVRSDVEVEFDYFVNGIRRGLEDLEPFAPNRSFVPRYRDEPFGAQYPAGLRRLLVENGILNADFTPNEATAQRMGWELRDARERAAWEAGREAAGVETPR